MHELEPSTVIKNLMGTVRQGLMMCALNKMEAGVEMAELEARNFC